LLPPASLYWVAEAPTPAPLVPAGELEGLVLELEAVLDGLVVELDGLVLELALDDPAEVREPAPIDAFARMKLSALDAAPAAALPLVPVAAGPLPDCRHPVTVIVWLERLLEPVCEAVLLPDCPLCAPTPTLSAAARTVPKRTLRFICVCLPLLPPSQSHSSGRAPARRVECVRRQVFVQTDCRQTVLGFAIAARRLPQ
jgi:hypothetical protein